MPVFNSLGSNYKASYVRQAMTPRFRDRSDELKKTLLSHYRANDVLLSYKGRQAIFAALSALHLPAASKVAVNGYTCYAVFQAVAAAGLNPFYVDVAEKSLHFGVDELEMALKKHDIAAVMVQNTLGYPADIEGIEALCKKHDIPLIEDLAHSIGMIYPDGREAGTVGIAAALSFSQDKVVDAISGGALIWHGSEKLDVSVKRLDLFDRWRDWIYPSLTFIIRNTYGIGFGKVVQSTFKNLRLMSRPMDGRADVVQSLTPWHSYQMLLRWRQRADAISHRQHIAEVYQKRLPQEIQLPHGKGATYIRFPILVTERNDLIEYLKRKDIHISDIWYEAPISPARTMESTNYEGFCPRAESIASQMVNLPTHANISIETAAKIAEGVNQWLSNRQ